MIEDLRFMKIAKRRAQSALPFGIWDLRFEI
jgi:hypothetical protein